MLKAFRDEYNSIIDEVPNSKAIKTLISTAFTLDGRPLVLYGAAKVGKALIGICREHGIAVDCICDRAVTGVFEGVPVVAPEELREKHPNAVVIICSKAFGGEICAGLMELGFSSDQIIPLPFEYPYCSSIKDFEPHLPGYEWAYGFFDDERSKRLVLDKIRLILCDRGIEQNTECGLYYECGLIELQDGEVFVDGGAFVGDSALEFLSKYGNRVCRPEVYSFEPDLTNYNKASVALSGIPEVTLIRKGLWNYETELSFSSGMGGRSSIVRRSGEDERRIQVVTLDGYFRDKPEHGWPAFIKLDVEGAENEALLGATEIIRRRKPKLAICAYHLTEDVYRLPQTISGIRDDYRYALRQHSPGCEDTVLYAV